MWVFNPSGLAGLPSTITFDPLSGCRKPTTATERATDMLAGVATPGQAGGDREFWAGQARRVLAALLHAAALGGLSMRDVLVWVADPDARGDGGAAAAAPLARAERTSRTRCSSSPPTSGPGPVDRATIMPALGWLTDPTAAAAADGGRLRRRPAARPSGGRCSCSAPRTPRPPRWSPR